MSILIITIVGTVAGVILVSEATSWMPYLSRRLVRSVLEGFPEELPKAQRDRWAEEIEADLNSYADRPVGGLWFALSLHHMGARRLVAELNLQLTLSALTKEPSRPVDPHDPRYLRRQEIAELLGFEGVEER